mmetsp:Transcript_13483/g.13210  ORF Transcript_13483/g.13210 Transcript_13483/m.13210 type:complete len:88 (-) Transcript_13483:74-337(-)|eukprot:CAMPEP_0170540762 /NCGR_PEP_ID=MMETSP0211-20121228/706_1 /TAXON_ID=311385 /ORGANISM="Pseudokeronopsis sp., Strain OXSARD2" /LENGTH=87 /DNA_ID=CAMNT_0010843285 /DNA_START=28 /DNA_END=291 /DNA_ORIENTATION=-
MSEFETLLEECKGKFEELAKTLDDETKARIYGFGAQGQFGDNDKEWPGDDAAQLEKDKWNAWTAFKGMSKEEAQTKFVECAKQVLGK